MWKIISSVLNLGNIEFIENEEGEATIKKASSEFVSNVVVSSDFIYVIM